MKSLKSLFRPVAGNTAPAVPKGYRVYAIGDIHGRLDLLNQLLASIHADIEQRPPAQVRLVFLGDLIDRGPESAGVVERLRIYARDGTKSVFILGNHEEVLLRILEGETTIIPSWLTFGGAECLTSYGVDPMPLQAMPDAEVVAAIRAAIPAEHVEFMKGFVDSCRLGDYLFVHAGIRPGVELGEQRQSDLRWIREPFLLDETDHGFVVVHGHTISADVEERPNRIGIDTGAFASGILTALVLEGPDRRYIDTRVAADAAVRATH